MTVHHNGHALILCPLHWPADRVLNDQHKEVSAALTSLLSLAGKGTDKVHQEVLCRVFGPDTSFDKPFLNFANPCLARLIKFDIKSVVLEIPG